MRLMKAAGTGLLLVVVSTCMPLIGNSGNSTAEPLLSVLSLPNETVCTGTKTREISATISFTNRSRKDILLKMAEGRNVTVLGLFGTRTLKPLLSSWMSMSDQGAKPTAESVLHPGETTWRRVRFRLAPDLLSQPGFYKVQFSYVAVVRAAKPTSATPFDAKTNWVIFQVRACENP